MALSTASKATALVVGLFLALGVNAAAIGEQGAFGMTKYKGYAEGVLAVKGTLSGVDIEMNGTMQEIFAQFAKENPEVEVNVAKANTTLAARGAENKADINCCPKDPFGWIGGNSQTIEEGIDYLNHVQARCGVSARSCVRVSCSYNAGIYLCNDNYYDIFPACPYIASYAQDLVNDCSTWETDGFFSQWVSCGQEFDTDRYNVIVHSDNC